jgi:catechol 2,3-dioxygenase-like lactoylglutathione lyase family enzyme
LEDVMLSDYMPMATIPTADLDRARAFYEGILGLGVGEDEVGGGVRYAAGGGGFLLYPSAFAGTNQATAMAFQIDYDEFDAETARLRAGDVSFDTFEWDEVTWVDGVATMDGGKAVWFRDPDGNIINLMAVEG